MLAILRLIDGVGALAKAQSSQRKTEWFLFFFASFAPWRENMHLKH